MNDNDLFGEAIWDWLADNSNDLLYTERDDGLISPDSISHYFYWGENTSKIQFLIWVVAQEGSLII